MSSSEATRAPPQLRLPYDRDEKDAQPTAALHLKNASGAGQPERIRLPAEPSNMGYLSAMPVLRLLSLQTIALAVCLVTAGGCSHVDNWHRTAQCRSEQSAAKQTLHHISDLQRLHHVAHGRFAAKLSDLQPFETYDTHSCFFCLGIEVEQPPPDLYSYRMRGASDDAFVVEAFISNTTYAERFADDAHPVSRRHAPQVRPGDSWFMGGTPSSSTLQVHVDTCGVEDQQPPFASTPELTALVDPPPPPPPLPQSFWESCAATTSPDMHIIRCANGLRLQRQTHTPPRNYGLSLHAPTLSTTAPPDGCSRTFDDVVDARVYGLLITPVDLQWPNASGSSWKDTLSTTATSAVYTDVETEHSFGCSAPKDAEVSCVDVIRRVGAAGFPADLMFADAPNTVRFLDRHIPVPDGCFSLNGSGIWCASSSVYWGCHSTKPRPQETKPQGVICYGGPSEPPAAFPCHVDGQHSRCLQELGEGRFGSFVVLRGSKRIDDENEVWVRCTSRSDLPLPDMCRLLFGDVDVGTERSAPLHGPPPLP